MVFASAGDNDTVFNGLTYIEPKGLGFNNPGFEMKEIERNGVSYVKPVMVGSGSLSEPGQPDFSQYLLFMRSSLGKICYRSIY